MKKKICANCLYCMKCFQNKVLNCNCRIKLNERGLPMTVKEDGTCRQFALEKSLVSYINSTSRKAKCGSAKNGMRGSTN